MTTKIKDLHAGASRMALEKRAHAVDLDNNATEAEVVAAEKAQGKHDSTHGKSGATIPTHEAPTRAKNSVPGTFVVEADFEYAISTPAAQMKKDRQTFVVSAKDEEAAVEAAKALVEKKSGPDAAKSVGARVRLITVRENEAYDKDETVPGF